MDQKATREKAVKAGIIIRMLAGCYDLFILFGVCFIAFIPISIAGESFGASPQWMKEMLITTLAFAYFSGFWHKGGATTGMRPWKIKVAMIDTGNYPPLTMSVFRAVVFCLTWLALGFTLLFMAIRQVDQPLFYLCAAIPAISLGCMLMTQQRQALHDLVAGTSVYAVASK